jgi:hypothetical protein
MRPMEIGMKRGPVLAALREVDPATGSDIATEGRVAAIVGTLGDVDHDGDIIEAGSVVDGAPVVLSAYAHDTVLARRLPVGKGALFIEGANLVFRGGYFLQVERARDAFETLKALGGQVQWSWAFNILRKRDPTPTEKGRGAVRVLTGLAPFEASPVLIGAGRHTRTLHAKSEAEQRRLSAEMAGEHERFLNTSMAGEHERFVRTSTRALHRRA